MAVLDSTLREVIPLKPVFDAIEAQIRNGKSIKGSTGSQVRSSGMLHIPHLHVDSEFMIDAEVNDVVTAAAGASGTTQALSMDRKQERCPANRHIRIIDRGFDGIHWEI